MAGHKFKFVSCKNFYFQLEKTGNTKQRIGIEKVFLHFLAIFICLSFTHKKAVECFFYRYAIYLMLRLHPYFSVIEEKEACSSLQSTQRQDANKSSEEFPSIDFYNLPQVRCEHIYLLAVMG